MKYNFTFAEAAEIFKQVDKIENLINDYNAKESKFNDESAVFETEFAKYGFTFFGAPASLSEMFESKSAAMKERDKAERKMFNAVKDFAQLLGLRDEFVNYTEERVRYIINNKLSFRVPKQLDAFKCLAMEASKRINF